MRLRFHTGRRLALALLLSLPAAACSDELPTVSGEEFFPGGTRATTLEVIVPAGQFLQTVGSFSGFSGPQDAGFLLVANRFEGALEANSLARLSAFPTSVTFTRGGQSVTDTAFTFVQGAVLVPLDTLATAGGGQVTLRLWEVGQAWDFGSVSWQLAADTGGVSVPWQTPGGTRGPLLSQLTLGAAGEVRDTLRFALDTVALRRIAREDFPGFLLTAEGSPSRLALGAISLRTDVRPQSAQDTTVALSVSGAPGGQTFVFTPDVPSSPTVWEAGGIRSARTLFRVDLGVRVPTCASGNCPEVPLREVTLNQVALLLDPVPVPQGFRPLGPMPLLVRRVAEPELGRRAPLGEVANDIAEIAATGAVVYAGSVFSPGESPFVIPITAFATELVRQDTPATALALLGEPQAATFGPAWFSGSPRLRILYTVPVRPTLP